MLKEHIAIIVLQLILFVILISVFSKIIQKILSTRMKIKNVIFKEISKTSFLKKTYDYIEELKRIDHKRSKRIKITPIGFILTSILISLIVFTTTFFLIKIFSTAIFLSLPFCFVPVFFIKAYKHREKQRIQELLPSYLINLKNNIELENNILKAIQKTPVESPLKQYIDEFNSNINNGVTPTKAFTLLKTKINMKQINLFVSACQVCYLSGGEFDKVLKKYLQIITRENNERERIKEEAYGSILTLAVMIIINLILVFFFIFKNPEYSLIIRETFLGRAILNFNVLSYYIIGILILKIYRMEE